MNLHNGTKLLCIGLQLSAKCTNVSVLFWYLCYIYIYKYIYNWNVVFLVTQLWQICIQKAVSLSLVEMYVLCQVCWGLRCCLQLMFFHMNQVSHIFIHICMYETTASDNYSHGQKWPLETPCGAFRIELHYTLTYSHTAKQCHVCSVNCPVSQCFVCHIVWCQYQGACFYLGTLSFVEIKCGVCLLALVHNNRPYQT